MGLFWLYDVLHKIFVGLCYNSLISKEAQYATKKVFFVSPNPI